MTKQVYKGNNRLLIGICLAVTTYWMFTTATGAILPTIAHTLHSTQGNLTTPISLAGLFSGSLIVVAGRFADRFGRKLLTIIGLVINIIGCLCLISLPYVWLFSIGRLLQGVSAAFIMPATLSMIQVYYEGKARNRAISFWSIASWGGSGISSLFAGTITTYFNWQLYFILSILFSVFAYFCILPTPETASQKKETGFDIVGVFLIISDLIVLNLMITQISFLKKHPLFILLALIYILVATILLFKREYKLGEKAILDLSTFKNKMFSSSTFSNFFLNFTSGSIFVYMMLLQNAFHLSALKAGLFTSGYLVMVVLFVRIGEKIMLKLKDGRLPMIGGALLAFIGIMMISFTFLSKSVYYMISFLGFSVMGVGLGLFATPSTSAAIEELDPDKSGAGSGIYKMASSLGGSFGIAIGGALYAFNVQFGDLTAARYAFIAMYVSALVAMLVVLIFFPKKNLSK